MATGNIPIRRPTFCPTEGPMSFGSFEYAMVVMAPRCAHCNRRIAGHGVRTAAGDTYCSIQCAGRGRAPT
jgi:hypothetical protein